VTTAITLPLTASNVAALTVLATMALLGCVHVLSVSRRKHCKCALCDGAYTVTDVLGEGAFGDVMVVRPRGSDRELVLKKIRVVDLNEASDAQLEAKELRGMRHAHIVRYVDDFLHQEADTRVGVFGRRRLYVCIIMERCASDLQAELEARVDQGVPFSQQEVIRLFAQMCSALRYCHARQIAHRDVKPQNMLLTEGFDVRVGDFGLCRQLHNGVDTYSDEAGTDCYKSPEMLLGGTIDSRKADVWGLGLVLYEMLTLRPVHEREGLLGAQALRNPRIMDVLAADVPANRFDQRLVSLMRRLVHPDPDRRPSLEDVMRRKVLRSALKHVMSSSPRS